MEEDPRYAPAGSYDTFLRYFLTDSPTDRDRFYEYVKEYIEVSQASSLEHLRTDLVSLYVEAKCEWEETNERDYFHNTMKKRAKVVETYPSQEALEKALETKKWFQTDTPHWYEIIIDRLMQVEWEIHLIRDERDETTGLPGLPVGAFWTVKPGQEEQLFNHADLDKELDKEIDRIFTVETEIFEERIAELKDVMEALAEHPLSAGSGIRQPRKRTQINYHTHPRKTISHPRVAIMHPQRTYQDVKNEIASELSSLPNFTARTRITVEGQTVEHTITTFVPGQGIGKALQQRIADIQARNRDPRYGGYCRPRKEVEAEIIQRQFACIGAAAPAQPQLPQPQPRHARQVPIQGKCPNCGASNAPGAQFCNQCGTKL